MKTVVAVFLLILTVNASDIRGHKHLSDKELRTTLESIKPHAITYGSGSKEVHVFVDPMCPLSQEYLRWVTSNERLKERYRYFIYLYKLKKYDSTALMRHIYRSDYPFEILRQIMVEHWLPDTIDGKPGEAVDRTIADVARAAVHIDVYKRPYFIILRSEQ